MALVALLPLQMPFSTARVLRMHALCPKNSAVLSSLDCSLNLFHLYASLAFIVFFLRRIHRKVALLELLDRGLAKGVEHLC